MDVLIVDDETHVIEAIQLLIPWSQYKIDTILSATNISDAKALLDSERPGLAYIDIMIGNELGLELMEYITKEKINTKVIAISGHSDFDYVRRMLLNGAVDYLLKPLSRAILLNATEKAIQEIAEESNKKSHSQAITQQLSYLSTERQRTLFLQLLSPDTSANAYAELSSLDSYFAESSGFQLLYCDLFFYPYHESQFSQLFTVFWDTVRKHLENSHAGSAVIKRGIDTEAVIIIHSHFKEAVKSVQRALTSLCIPGEYSVHFGISRIHKHPADMIELYDEAKAAFLSIRLQTYAAPVIQFHTGPIPKPASTEQPENLIFSAILNGDHSQIRGAVSLWLDALLSKADLSFFTIKYIHIRYKSMYNRWVQYFLEKYESFDTSRILIPSEQLSLADHEPDFFKKQMLDTYSELCASLSRHLHQLLRSSNLPHQVADYMELNYQQKFNQAEYAKMFNVNKEYLCRKFKEVYGVSMVTYLNEIRINHAKRLLRTTNLKISNISELIGYDNDKYFAKLFKKATAVTPSAYRLMHVSED